MVPDRRLTVIFCVPGQLFSTMFLYNWSRLLQWCEQNNVNYGFSIVADPNIYNVRNLCLKGDISKGRDQKPFQGKIDYDFILWIDSDIMFTLDQLQKLLSHDTNIVSGLYLMANGKEYATANPWKVGESENIQRSIHLTPSDISGKKDLIEVPYTGFGFILVKQGVFEVLEYPWFRPIYSDLKDMKFFCPMTLVFASWHRKMVLKCMLTQQ